MPPRKEVDLEALLRLHETGLSDSALAKSLGASRKRIRKVRIAAGLQSNFSSRARRVTDSDVQAIKTYLESQNGICDLTPAVRRFGRHAINVARANDISFVKMHHRVILCLPGFESQATARLSEINTEHLAGQFHLAQEGRRVQVYKAFIKYLDARDGFCTRQELRAQFSRYAIWSYYKSGRIIKISLPGTTKEVFCLLGKENEARQKLEELLQGPLVTHVIQNNGVTEWSAVKRNFGRHAITQGLKTGRLKKLYHPNGRPAIVYAAGFEEQARAAYQTLVEQHWVDAERRAEEEQKRVAPEYDFVTLEELASAIEISVRRETGHEIKAEHAKQIAEYVKNFFGYADRIIDNHLETDDRTVFRMLEDDFGILKAESEPAPLLIDGREWRSQYWILDKNHVRQILSKSTAPAKAEDEATRLYKQAFVEIGSRPERDLDSKLREAKA